jgi:amino acid adenylation domain-containing protein
MNDPADAESGENNIEAVYPLTPMQEGIFFHSVAAGLFFQQLVCEVRSKVDSARLKDVCREIIARHPVLRTFFFWKDRPKPIQVVCKSVALHWHEENWEEDSPAEQQKQLARFLEEDRARGFEITRPPLSRWALLRMESERYYIVWSFHHLLLDGWSLSLVLKEVLAIYEARQAGCPISLPHPRPFRDYVEWLNRQDRSKARMAWKERLQGFSSPISLRLKSPRQSLPGCGERRKVLPEALSGELRAIAARHRVTLNAVVQAAWGILLAVYSGKRDIVFGVTHSGRSGELPRVESIVGLCINTSPVRICIEDGEHFLDLTRRLLKEQFDQEVYRYVSLADVQSCSEIPRGTPLFETLLVFENYPISRNDARSAAGLRIGDVYTIERTNYPISLVVIPERLIEMRITFDQSRFGAESMQQLVNHLAAILNSICRDPASRVGRIRLMESEEEKTILKTWNATHQDFDEGGCVHHWFERHAATIPDRTALIFRGEKLGYHQLNERANRFAHYLDRLGVGAESLVSVCLERSLDMVISLYGILKAGATYVPIDPEYPKERLAYMLGDTRATLLITQRRLLSHLPDVSTRVVCWEEIQEDLETCPASNPEMVVHREQLAYVIYTSGSTGRPKGVMNTHGGLANRIRWMQDTYGLRSDDRILQKTPFSFDVSVWEFFWPLTAGACLVMAEPGNHRDPGYLVDIVRREDITTLHFVPSMLELFLAESDVQRCTSLRRVICSGEALSLELQERFHLCLPTELHNLYGPTEASIDVTYWPCRRKHSIGVVPIGRPIANTQIYILDGFMQPVPTGVVGEIYIAGVGLARGYHRQPELTAEKFIPDPFSTRAGGRLYRTGDMARFLPDGAIEYLGRLDHQVKVRGFRIELEEIEAALRAHPSVRSAVVVVREESAVKLLVAYLVLAPGVSERLDSFRGFLTERLPEYMAPNRFVTLAALPLTPNGKVDRKALPAPAVTAAGASLALPETEAEHAIAEIWQEYLQVERVGRNDNFFELGGDSLRMVPIHHRLEQLFERKLSIVELFRYPTAAALAKWLTDSHEEASAGVPHTGSRDDRRGLVRTRRGTRLKHRAEVGPISQDA